MKNPLFAAVFYLTGSCFLTAQVKNVLLLGDSHLKGYFGEYSQRELYETRKYNILSVAIRGVGLLSFTISLQNTCCGYKVRMTCAGDSIKKDVPYIERTDKASDDLFLKQFGSRLTTILKT